MSFVLQSIEPHVHDVQRHPAAHDVVAPRDAAPAGAFAGVARSGAGAGPGARPGAGPGTRPGAGPGARSGPSAGARVGHDARLVERQQVPAAAGVRERYHGGAAPVPVPHHQRHRHHRPVVAAALAPDDPADGGAAGEEAAALGQREARLAGQDKADPGSRPERPTYPVQGA